MPLVSQRNEPVHSTPSSLTDGQMGRRRRKTKTWGRKTDDQRPLAPQRNPFPGSDLDRSGRKGRKGAKSRAFPSPAGSVAHRALPAPFKPPEPRVPGDRHDRCRACNRSRSGGLRSRSKSCVSGVLGLSRLFSQLGSAGADLRRSKRAALSGGARLRLPRFGLIVHSLQRPCHHSLCSAYNS